MKPPRFPHTPLRRLETLLRSCCVASFLLLALPASLSFAAGPGKGVIGSWIYSKGPTDFDSIEFGVEDGEQVFHCWLHDRPLWSGRWTLNGDELRVELPDRFVMRWTVKSIGKKKLVLFADGAKKLSVYRRARVSG